MADYNAEAVKKLAADLYGAGNIAARDYGGEYAQLADAQTQRQNQAAAEYNAALEALKQENAAAYGTLNDTARELSQRRLDAPAEARTANGGGIYGTAGEDLTESAKILHDNALGNAMNDIAGAAKSDADEAELLQRIAEYERQQNVYQGLADLEQQQIAAQRGENQAAAGDLLNANTSLDTILSQAYGLEQSENALTETQKQNAYNNALSEVNIFGKVMTKAASEALGVPIGTSAAYAKVNRVKSSGGKSSGSKSSASSELTQEDYAQLYDTIRADGRDHAAANSTIKKLMTANGESKENIKELSDYMYAYEQSALKNTFANLKKSNTKNSKSVDWQK